MQVIPPKIAELVTALRRLPGIGPRSAQRLALALLGGQGELAGRLAQALLQAIEQVHLCESCRMYTEDARCVLCTSTQRDGGVVCVVETPADVIALENTGSYRGIYFVLYGHLSPLDRIGPSEIGLDLFARKLEEGRMREVILATNATVEGEATAHFIAHMCQQQAVPSTRIAHGVPMGGELEYLDGHTLIQAIQGRRAYD
ncbi:RecR protein [mine drainage metagenome]|uniref:RecR protein n=1 Tax=mine drainage metagenome TaxID=410659 RepID=T1BUY3_9ZZZZ